MHIVILVLGVLGGLAFWWYRVKMMNEAAGEVVDAVGRVRGSMRRKTIRQQNMLSPVTAIDDPVVAAATLLTGIVSDDVALSTEREATIARAVDTIAVSGEKAAEAMTYAKWAAAQVDDAQVVIDKLAPFLAAKLDEPEKQALIGMVREASHAEGPPLPDLEVKVRRLKQKIGLRLD